MPFFEVVLLFMLGCEQSFHNNKVHSSLINTYYLCSGTSLYSLSERLPVGFGPDGHHLILHWRHKKAYYKVIDVLFTDMRLFFTPVKIICTKRIHNNIKIHNQFFYLK